MGRGEALLRCLSRSVMGEGGVPMVSVTVRGGRGGVQISTLKLQHFSFRSCFTNMCEFHKKQMISFFDVGIHAHSGHHNYRLIENE